MFKIQLSQKWKSVTYALLPVWYSYIYIYIYICIYINKKYLTNSCISVFVTPNRVEIRAVRFESVWQKQKLFRFGSNWFRSSKFYTVPFRVNIPLSFIGLNLFFACKMIGINRNQYLYMQKRIKTDRRLGNIESNKITRKQTV